MIRKKQFLATVEGGNVSHAILLVGGTREEFNEVAAAIGRAIAADDFTTARLEEEGSIPIETIRRLRVSLSLKPAGSMRHFVIIPAAQMMTPEAQNALLKLLEEPVAPTVFLLGVPDERSVLPTIVSRCQRVRLENDFGERPSAVSLEEISTMSLAEKFKLAETLAKDPDLPRLLDSWMMEIRERLQAGDETVGNDLRGLLRAKEYVTETQTNRRLVLEDLFLDVREHVR